MPCGQIRKPLLLGERNSRIYGLEQDLVKLATPQSSVGLGQDPCRLDGVSRPENENASRMLESTHDGGAPERARKDVAVPEHDQPLGLQSFDDRLGGAL